MTDWKENFWANVEEQDECLNWQGMLWADECPQFYHKGLKSARVLAFEMGYNRKPVGKLINTCGNKACINHEHLQEVGPGIDLRRVRYLTIDSITRHLHTQPREFVNRDVIEEYAKAMTEGDRFPPVIAFFDGSLYWLADGYHRIAALELLGEHKISVELFDGGKREAILYSVGANAKHGLRRSNSDKRHSVMKLLEDEEWVQWSDREIGRRCGVDNSTVSKYRGSLLDSNSERLVTTKHGTVTRMDVKNIGKSSKEDELSFHAKLKAIAAVLAMTDKEVIEKLVDDAYEVYVTTWEETLDG